MIEQKIFDGGPFQSLVSNDLQLFLDEQRIRFPEEEMLKMDMHCHDLNSDVPDELLGRILNVPETWLETKRLVKVLRSNGCDALTITNHNNARSCFELLDKGTDILTGAEFSCTVPDFQIGIHVLTYGFTPEQEKLLNKLRRDVYAFLEYANQQNIPTIWAHPLYYYSRGGIPPMDFFEKMALVFERFEVLNGQRDTWQNMLVKAWINTLTPDTLDSYADKYNMDPSKYCRNVYEKSFSGGSDSHMGIFSGLTGTYLHIPDLKKRLENEKTSALALEAIRAGNMAPYGSHQNSEKLTIAFLDYVFQIALYKKDTGLLRILLHKGTTQDKITALLISNAFSEIQQHKVTMNFIKVFHQCFMGKKPEFTRRFFVPQAYKPVFDDAVTIAKARNNGSGNLVEVFNQSVSSMSDKLSEILFRRLSKKLQNSKKAKKPLVFDLKHFMTNFELPSDIRVYLEKQGRKNGSKPKKGLKAPDIPGFLDGLSFPFLASSLILAANFTSARVLYNNRQLLQNFSSRLKCLRHPQRMLWMTDTFEDNNGVSMVLKAMHHHIKRHNLPIDILVCSNTLQSDDHLVVIKPMAEYEIPFYRQQTFKIPNFLEIHKLFQAGEYDRLICSTEGPLGLAGVYLKHAYSVPAYFYLHTDWIMFSRRVLEMESGNLSRLRRLLRLYYGNFDGLFVLNTDQAKWLTGRHMGFDPKNVFLTAHWAEKKFFRRSSTKAEMFDLPLTSTVILFAGRVSHEKGVMELPDIYTKLKAKLPEIGMVIAGTGPAEEDLKKAMPDAVYLGWVDHDELPNIYSAADLLILPSKFDTFGCVVLEALSCGLPVVAYNTKGPKDIIQHEKNGFVVQTKQEIVQSAYAFLTNANMRKSFRTSALKRAKAFSVESIMKKFLNDTGLAENLNE
jgi:glycosyltransferase involved in cell wall biosynthesis